MAVVVVIGCQAWTVTCFSC